MALGIIAQIVFWVLLIVGGSDLGVRRASVFVGLWLLGYFGAGWIRAGGFLFDSYVAMLDIALVFVVFKGDVRLR